VSYVVPTYAIAFKSDDDARTFCTRLHLEIDKDVSTFRTGQHVLVFDGSDHGHRERIMQLARTTAAAMVRIR
jgi:hypothetical protein